MKAKCPTCNAKGEMYNPEFPKENGSFKLLGKIPTGHLILECDNCKTEIKFDPMSLFNRFTIYKDK